MSITSSIRQNIDFVDKNSHISLDFVYLQLDNITKLVGNNTFKNELVSILTLVLDRDNNGIFDSNDIKLLREVFEKKDGQAIVIMNFCLEIYNAVMLAISKIDKPMLKFDKDALEGIFFGVFAYTLFQYSGNSESEKEDIVVIVTTVYNLLKTVDNTIKISKGILKLFKSKGICKCITGGDDVAHNRIDKELELVKERVKGGVIASKTNTKLQNKVEELSSKLEALERSGNNTTVPIEETIVEVPVEETIVEVPIEETIVEVPIEETIVEVPVEETVIEEQPIVNPEDIDVKITP